MAGTPTWNVRVMSKDYTLAALLGRPDKAFKHRMRLVWFTLKFGMELARNEEGMVGMLDDFHQFAVRRLAAENKAGLFKAFPVSVVEFKAVAMPLFHHEGAVKAGCFCADQQLT